MRKKEELNFAVETLLYCSTSEYVLEKLYKANVWERLIIIITTLISSK